VLVNRLPGAGRRRTLSAALLESDDDAKGAAARADSASARSVKP